MIPSDQLAQTFKSNHRLAKRLLEGLTHAESLLSPGFKGNCLNWVLGHIVYGRGRVLYHLDRPDLLDEAALARYKTGSEPARVETALPLEKLVADLDDSQGHIETILAEVTEAFLAEIVATRFGERPRWAHISGLGWHETYHTGQLEPLRQMVLDRREEE